jgi:hypothetical protein
LNKKKAMAILLFFSLLFAIIIAIYLTRPPGQPLANKIDHHITFERIQYKVSAGDFPGITWVDDIHPIFIRNKCDHCHTRGKEVFAEGLESFALGLIDPKDKNNAYYSYHELVYAEGAPQIQEGETLRDGQCCWPLNYPDEHQRRIWVGHSERSAIMHKLDRDYYDWRKTPRFVEEGLSLLWGLPMPLYHIKNEYGESVEVQHFTIRPFYERILFHLSLWLGGGRDKLHHWPPRIPASDRAMLRYWIDNTLQVMEEDTGIEVQVFNSDEKLLSGVDVKFIGNYNSVERKNITDQNILKTDGKGKTLLLFPYGSVVTQHWFVSSQKNEMQTTYKKVQILPGRITRISLIIR